MLSSAAGFLQWDTFDVGVMELIGRDQVANLPNALELIGHSRFEFESRLSGTQIEPEHVGDHRKVATSLRLERRKIVLPAHPGGCPLTFC
jgi:hypothetical protein